jgi:hypothetical protein
MSAVLYDRGGPGFSASGSDQGGNTPEILHERPPIGVFILPGGYVDDLEVAHYEVEMSPVTGFVEEYLGSLPGNTTLANAVTQLLLRCVKRIGSIRSISESLIGDLLVGDRDYLILRLREMMFGQRVDAMIHCPNLACSKIMDLSFSLDEIVIERKALKQRSFLVELDVSSGGAISGRSGALKVEFRLPTGAFQEAASVLVGVSEGSAVSRLLSMCISRVGDVTDIDDAAINALPAETLRQIEDAIRRQAPSPEIEIEAKCPDCAHEFLFPVDFSRFFFAEMKDNLRNLEYEVHFLAKHYHWAESEILSMTRRKRLRYVSLLREEMDL